MGSDTLLRFYKDCPSIVLSAYDNNLKNPKTVQLDIELSLFNARNSGKRMHLVYAFEIFIHAGFFKQTYDTKFYPRSDAKHGQIVLNGPV